MTHEAADRHDQVVAAAIRVVEALGAAGTTMDAVAAEAGVSPEALARDFSSRDELLRDVITRVVDDTSAALRESLDLEQGIEHALRQGVGTFWARLLDGGTGMRVAQFELALYSARTDAGSGLARLEFARYTDLLTELCAEAAAFAGEECAVPLDVLGRLVLGVVDGLVLQHIANPDPARSQRDLAHALDMLVALAAPRRR
ncbi:TetR/AcrR family transcriptional regulator [Nocardioides daeguensis]|uniref:TetR/AcrR family transcriptional regulator n=1 Tax=Nocardioides daeguensis TaxID=908359 RepID=A0ABP6WGK5_9ACTN|nr:TetR/AcrR family transcriptional regulator [Nocardioides daeguensis]MBV6728073.1 TetR/AcrR family transcriptional regulator [Nocardioides daeguensis]MCR1774147.1 TetR/AcrR family transcriptional regulator [Nocardioides daeguensis]